MLQNFCGELLDDLREDNRERAALLKNLCEDSWRDPILENKLELCLTEESY